MFTKLLTIYSRRVILKNIWALRAQIFLRITLYNFIFKNPLYNKAALELFYLITSGLVIINSVLLFNWWSASEQIKSFEHLFTNSVSP